MGFSCRKHLFVCGTLFSLFLAVVSLLPSQPASGIHFVQSTNNIAGSDVSVSKYAIPDNQNKPPPPASKTVITHQYQNDSKQVTKTEAKEPSSSHTLSATSTSANCTALNCNHWWDISYYDEYFDQYSRFHGEFVAQANSINGLSDGDHIEVLPLNIAIGTTTNLVWFQFNLDFFKACPNGPSSCYRSVQWSIWDITAPTGSCYEADGAVYNYEFISSPSAHVNSGLPYTAGHSYHWDLFADGNRPNYMVFDVYDDTTGAFWWDEWQVPALNLVVSNPKENCFSPAAGIEGYTQYTTTSLSSVPFMPYTERYGIFERSGIYPEPVFTGSGKPSGISESMMQIGATGDWYWTMYQTGTAQSTSLVLNSISTVPWGKPITVSGTLYDTSLTNGRIYNSLISFTGTGAYPLPSTVATRSDGTFSVTVNTGAYVSSGLTVQAHTSTFAGTVGSFNYLNSDSAVQNYSQLIHTTSLSLSGSNSVPWSRPTYFTATLLDASNGYTPISGKTIHFDGTGVIDVADKTTDGNGKAFGTGISPSSVASGWTYQAHYGGDGLYAAKDSTVKTYTTTKHYTSLSLSSPSNVPWSRPTAFYAYLKDSTNSSSPIVGATIHWDGTGVIGIAGPLTDSNGRAKGTGTSPNSVASGWTVQAHYAGRALYYAKDSTIKSYSTTPHKTTLTLSISPSTVVHGGKYQVSGTLKDSLTGSVSASRTISFTADSPIVISNTLTGSTGTYLVTGLVAPSTPNTYHITANYGGEVLYAASTSGAKTITVT